MDELEKWAKSVELTPTIVALRERVRSVLRGELDLTFPKLGVPEAERQKLEAMCEAMVNKLLHQPLTELKQSQTSHDGSQLVMAVQRLFKLEDKVKLSSASQVARAEGEFGGQPQAKLGGFASGALRGPARRMLYAGSL